MSARNLQIAVAVSIVPLGVSAILLALMSDHLERPTVTALYRAYLVVVPMLVGLFWWRRRPGSQFGPVLILFGISAWGVAWQSSDWPLLFDLGVLAEAPAVVLTFYLFLAFPSGRLTTGADRLLIAAMTVVELGFYVPLALGSPEIGGIGPLSTCVPACPDNVLQIGSAPDLVDVLSRWQTYLMLVVAVVVLVVYAARLRAASRPRRRALIAVAATSLLFLPAYFVFHFSRRVLELDPVTLEGMAWFVVGTRILLPLGFLIALLQADLFAGVARGKLLEELVGRPSPDRWRESVARALDDPALRIAYWDPSSGAYREPDGGQLAAPAPAGRAWAEIDREGRPVAVMIIDAALAEDPELVRTATSATRLAVETGDLEGVVRDSQARILAAGDLERRRIARDLHDSAQQRLVALRIHLDLAGEGMDGAGKRMVEQLGTQVDVAIEELRGVARGMYPAILRDAGLGAALRSVARHAAIAISVEDRWQRRHSEEVELAAYFCCLEALQNAAKHAGPGTVATVCLSEENGAVRFTVEDDGDGFDPAVAGRGAGLQNITDRVAAAGGTLRIESSIGDGTRVTAELPG